MRIVPCSGTFSFSLQHGLLGPPANAFMDREKKSGNHSRKRTKERLFCSRCRKKYEVEPLLNCLACGGPLTYLTPLTAADHWPKAKNARHAEFSSFFPIPDSVRSKFITLGEGGTPLNLCARLGASMGPRRLYVKNEGLNPTASWKDRPISLAVNCALGFGSKYVTIYSCGNAGSAAAAYAAKAGLGCVVLAMPSIKPNMVDLIRAYGGVVAVLEITPRELWVEGQVGKLLMNAQKELGWFPLTIVANPSFGSPYYTEGYKSIAYEITLELELAPDWVIVPVGSGEGLCGIWKGFLEAHRFGWISKLPKMIGVQASGAAPLVAAFKKEATEVTPIGAASTIASGIEVMISSNGALNALYESRGCALSLSDEEIRKAGYLLSAHEGLNVSPEGAATVAGALKMYEWGRIRPDDCIVCISTASGIKYPKFHMARRTMAKDALPPDLTEIDRYVQRVFR